MTLFRTGFSVFVLMTIFSQLQAEDELSQFVAAHALFESSLAGNEADTETAIAQFAKLVELDPEQPLYLAYLGSAYTLKARDAWMPWSRLSNAEKGLDMIDKALLMLEQRHDDERLRGSIVSSETRLVAINTFLEVPAFLNRAEDAKALLKETLDSPVFGASAPEVKGRLFMQAATIAHREKQLDQAVAYLRRALPLLPPGRHQQLAKQQLMKDSGQ